MSVEVVPTTEIEVSAHETDQTHSWKRLMGIGALTLAACGVLGGAAGAAEAAFTPTTVELGPHTATVEATVHDRFTFDLGPLGSAERQSTWPIGGFTVTVKGIPTTPDQSPLTTASTIASQYEQLFTDPKHIEQSAITTVMTRIEHDTVEGAALFGAAGLGGLLLTEPGRRRRCEQQTDALKTLDSLDANEDQRVSLQHAITKPRPRRHRLVAAAASTVLLASCSGDIAQANGDRNLAVDPVLAGTPFADYAINGALLRAAIDQGATHIEQFISTTEQFYDQVKTNFNAAFAEKFGGTKPDRSGLTYVLSISDNHCNIGMDRVHGAIADAFGVDTVVDSGDMTMGGTAAEEECVSSEADALKAKSRDLLFAAGNHDSPTIEQKAVKHGFRDLHMNSVVTSHGISYLGEDDVNESTFTVPMHLRGSETVDDETEAITAATAKTHPDVLVVHEPEMAEPAVINGDVPLAIDGHLHVWHAPKMLNKATDSYQFIEGTSGGAKKNALTIGTLQQAAIDTIFAFDNATKRAVGYYIVTANPDKSVAISDYTPIAPTVSHQNQLALAR